MCNKEYHILAWKRVLLKLNILPAKTAFKIAHNLKIIYVLREEND